MILVLFAVTHNSNVTYQVVVKRNTVLSNGGIGVRGHSTNVLVENNRFLNSSVGVHVANDNHTTFVTVKSNHIGPN